MEEHGVSARPESRTDDLEQHLNLQRSEIGLQLVTEEGSLPHFGIGTTSAFFQHLGKYPNANMWLNMIVKISIILTSISLRGLLRIPSKPTANLHLRELIISKILSVVTNRIFGWVFPLGNANKLSENDINVYFEYNLEVVTCYASSSLFSFITSTLSTENIFDSISAGFTIRDKYLE